MADISYYKERQEFGMGKVEARKLGLIPSLKQEREQGLRKKETVPRPQGPNRKVQKVQDPTTRKKSSCTHCRDHHPDDPCGAKNSRGCTKPCRNTCGA